MRVIIRNNHKKCSSKKGILKNVAKFTRKHLLQNLFLIKIQAWPLQLGTCAFLWILWNLKEHHFYRTPPRNSTRRVTWSYKFNSFCPFFIVKMIKPWVCFPYKNGFLRQTQQCDSHAIIVKAGTLENQFS